MRAVGTSGAARTGLIRTRWRRYRISIELVFWRWKRSGERWYNSPGTNRSPPCSGASALPQSRLRFTIPREHHRPVHPGMEICRVPGAASKSRSMGESRMAIVTSVTALSSTVRRAFPAPSLREFGAQNRGFPWQRQTDIALIPCCVMRFPCKLALYQGSLMESGSRQTAPTAMRSPRQAFLIAYENGAAFPPPHSIYVRIMRSGSSRPLCVGEVRRPPRQIRQSSTPSLPVPAPPRPCSPSGAGC